MASLVKSMVVHSCLTCLATLNCMMFVPLLDLKFSYKIPFWVALANFPKLYGQPFGLAYLSLLFCLIHPSPTHKSPDMAFKVSTPVNSFLSGTSVQWLFFCFLLSISWSSPRFYQFWRARKSLPIYPCRAIPTFNNLSEWWWNFSSLGDFLSYLAWHNHYIKRWSHHFTMVSLLQDSWLAVFGMDKNAFWSWVWSFTSIILSSVLG